MLRDRHRKPAKEKVERFLQLRRDNTAKTSGIAPRRSFNAANSIANGSHANDGQTHPSLSGQLDLQNDVTDSKKDADQAWIKRFGKSDGTPGDGSQSLKDGKSRDGKNGHAGHRESDGKQSGGTIASSTRESDRSQVPGLAQERLGQ